MLQLLLDFTRSSLRGADRGLATVLLLNAGLIIWASPATAQPGIQLELESDVWRFISLPFAPPADQASVADLFGDDIGGEYGAEWVIFGFDENANRYTDVGLDGDLVGGKAYWIIQALGYSVTLEMPNESTGTPVAQSAACDVDLSDGPQAGCFGRPSRGNSWNAVGNPFYGNPQLNDVRVKASSGLCAVDEGCSLANAREQNIVSDDFWGYDGVRYQRISGGGRLEPWAGYWNSLLPAGPDLAPVLLLPRTVVASAVRHTSDQPDVDDDANQIHVIYAIPKDASHELLDVTGLLHGTVRKVNNTFFSAGDGGHRFNIDENPESAISGFPPYDISFHSLPRNADAYATAAGVDLMKNDFFSAGFNDSKKLYLVYYMGRSDAYGCERSGAGNSPFAILFLDSPQCGPVSFMSWRTFTPTGGWERLAFYSIVTTLGFPHSCAANYDFNGTYASMIDDVDDMLFRSGHFPRFSPLWTQNGVMDAARDDYYAPNGLPAGCSVNLYHSAFLAPDEGSSTPQGTELPAGWLDLFD